MLTLLYIVIVFFLVFANGFFVASEFALVGVRRPRIEMLATNGSRRARRLLGLLSNLNAYISATQLIGGGALTIVTEAAFVFCAPCESITVRFAL